MPRSHDQCYEEHLCLRTLAAMLVPDSARGEALAFAAARTVDDGLLHREGAAQPDRTVLVDPAAATWLTYALAM
jgi:hypothetical protein